MKELQDFIARFSANASKSKQATSRKKNARKKSRWKIFNLLVVVTLSFSSNRIVKLEMTY